jgi:hypothetical protein
MTPPWLLPRSAAPLRGSGSTHGTSERSGLIAGLWQFPYTYDNSPNTRCEIIILLVIIDVKESSHRHWKMSLNDAMKDAVHFALRAPRRA